LTKIDRFLNGWFGLADRIKLGKYDDQKSRVYGGKTGCKKNDFWLKLTNNRL
jgi:hypothetical protein